MERAEHLRLKMVDDLKRSGVLRTGRIERALLAVPRHEFLPDLRVEEAYENRAVMVKRSAAGIGLSSVSQPAIVAMMLEALEVADGHRVLDVGTGAGYNAALLAELVGAAGHVVTIELEPDLAEQAARRLAVVGAAGVEVVTGDGAAGHPPGAPYDRVIVTAGATEVAPPWVDQLVDGGRLVVPICDAEGLGSLMVFTKRDGRLEGRDEGSCAFLPMRSAPSDG
jgi:protein-L-isoaspartate(D-aspartate) O-methyltransferase